jgi:hypothetical protein
MGMRVPDRECVEKTVWKYSSGLRRMRAPAWASVLGKL